MSSLDLSDLAAEVARASPGSAVVEQGPATGLPTPLSSFVGRERQLDEIERLLGAHRLLTLGGPGGCGKTRLALAVAARLAGSFRHGVAIVPLAALEAPSLVAPAVARALGLQESPGRSHRDAVTLALRTRELLLVLDNLEHLLAAGPVVGEWLAACPGLRILGTSRERLRLQGEQVYPVPPLGLPDPAGADPRSSESVRLFVERARAVQPDFVLTDENAPVVTQICRRLDGLPLAIELAAARVRLLPPRALLARLGRRLPLLVGGPRDLPARQRTLRDTVAWSHDLLDETEQRLFRQLAVFVGGWTLDAAERVASSDESLATRHSPLATFEGLASLVDKSLVFRTDPSADEPRFAMLETIREYALEQLEASGESKAVRHRHADYYLAMAEEAEPHLTGAEQARWRTRLTSAHADLRAALRWLLDRPDAETAARLLWALGVFWWARGHLAEAGGWAEKILAAPSLAPVAEARASTIAGLVAWKRGAYASAVTLLTRGRALFRDLGDGRGAARAAMLLGYALPRTGEVERGIELMREARAGFEAVGDRWGAAMTVSGLGGLALLVGDLDEAQRRWEEYLALARAADDRRSVGQGLEGLGHVALLRGDRARAVALVAESLLLLLEAGQTELVAYGLLDLACVAAGGRQPIRAARLLGIGDRLLAEVGVDEWPVRRDLHVSTREAARSQLEDEAFATAYAEGGRMSVQAAVEYALAVEPGPVEPRLAAAADGVPSEPVGPAPTSATRPRRRAGGLTEREVEVARLVAEGKTNREIAEALVLSERTVSSHLDHIFAKLGVSSRTAVATFALRNGLA